MKKIALALLILVTFAACQDKNKGGDKNIVTPKQYSTWIVNGIDTFKTNNVYAFVSCDSDHSNCMSGLQSLDKQNGFIIIFPTDHLPSSGSWQLGDYNQGPFDKSNYASIVFFYKDYKDKGGYIPINPEFDTLFINSVNGKVIYKLKPAWFVNNKNPLDSIMIEGAFIRP